MELNEIQEKIKEYFEKSGFEIWPKFAILARLEEEISEIGRTISVDEGLREKWKVDNMNYTDEFGDALFQLIHLANQCDVDINEALKHVLKKYQKYVDKSKNEK
jgi:NTP pyrophosphatase (non-canonical NTP hydrolase)|tara:strand:+ start:29 stop:340 length:312 start_codon:yes stop_codon:yes gene_type:complete